MWCSEDTRVVHSLEEARAAAVECEALDVFRIVLLLEGEVTDAHKERLLWSFLPVGFLSDGSRCRDAAETVDAARAWKARSI